jgi:spermidine synthase
VVELLPEVVRAAADFAPVLESDRQPRVYVSDARRFVHATQARYDVIVADLFQPARSGSGALYSVEHFEAVRARLSDAGVFCQWLPLHQLELTSLRSVVRSFLAVYPRATALLATGSLDTPVLGLVGTAQRLDIRHVREHIARVHEPARLAALHLDDEYAVLGSWLSGSSALRRFAGDAPLNTDDRPVVSQRAPRDTYAPSSSARERLLSVMHALQIEPDDVVTRDASERARLAAYWSARDRFLELGTRVRPTQDASAMLAQLGSPLLSILHQSPDFRPAYDPLLSMAAALPESASGQARALLSQLVAAQPARSEAAHLLQRLAH